MKKTIFFSILIILFFSSKSFSQACGGGILNFSIYTLNGDDVLEFDYEIFPISKDLPKEKYFTGNGSIIQKDFFDDLIEENTEKLNQRLKYFLELSKISKKGKLKSTLEFKTFELNNFPIVLKITKNKKSIYILGNYFGGCDNYVSLIWSKNVLKLN